MEWIQVYVDVADTWIRALAIPLAVYILLSGLDEIFIDSICVFTWLSQWTGQQPASTEDHAAALAAPQKRTAILVPLWQEDAVIRQMVDHNVERIAYTRYDLYLGVYPNDSPTLEAAHELALRHPNVHVAVCGQDGPTSKADCLNWLFRRMLDFEQEQGDRYEVIITHDAEDVIHAEALHWINYYTDVYDMVQVPVLPLPTPLRDWTHGLYCDEFAEFQTKDMPGRQILGGFIPSNGVGTGFTRWALDRLAAAEGRIFEPECLTEDYENGLRLHLLGCPQLFMPVRMQNGEPMATREYFPRTMRGAIRQRTRWVTGIALQSWERHGWKGGLGTMYWLWRDRKGLIGNPASMLASALFLYGLATLGWSRWSGHPWGIGLLGSWGPAAWLLGSTTAIQIVHLAVRGWCSARIYGWRFALGVPLRAVYGNYINFRATIGALWRYAASRITRTRLAWLKTDHSYPSHAGTTRRRRLGELLVAAGRISAGQLESALEHQPDGQRLGEFLVARRLLTEEQVYQALSVQASMPLSRLDPRRVRRNVARSLPAHVVDAYRVLPFEVKGGFLYVATPELPGADLLQRLAAHTGLTVRMQLLTASNYDALRRSLL